MVIFVTKRNSMIFNGLLQNMASFLNFDIPQVNTGAFI